MKTNQTNSINNGMISGIVELNEWRLLELVCWWVMGAAAPMAPPREENKPINQLMNEMKERKGMKEEKATRAAVQLE